MSSWNSRTKPLCELRRPDTGCADYDRRNRRSTRRATSSTRHRLQAGEDRRRLTWVMLVDEDRPAAGEDWDEIQPLRGEMPQKQCPAGRKQKRGDTMKPTRNVALDCALNFAAGGRLDDCDRAQQKRRKGGERQCPEHRTRADAWIVPDGRSPAPGRRHPSAGGAGGAAGTVQPSSIAREQNRGRTAAKTAVRMA